MCDRDKVDTTGSFNSKLKAKPSLHTPGAKTKSIQRRPSKSGFLASLKTRTVCILLLISTIYTLRLLISTIYTLRLFISTICTLCLHSVLIYSRQVQTYRRFWIHQTGLPRQKRLPTIELFDALRKLRLSRNIDPERRDRIGAQDKGHIVVRDKDHIAVQDTALLDRQNCSLVDGAFHSC